MTGRLKDETWVNIDFMEFHGSWGFSGYLNEIWMIQQTIILGIFRDVLLGLYNETGGCKPGITLMGMFQVDVSTHQCIPE